MRDIDTIIIHCSATPPHMDIGAEEIGQWHRARGWKGIGYHYVVTRSGEVQEGRPVERIGAHAKGHNTGSIGVCWVGGVDADGQPEDNRTPAQRAALMELVVRLRHTYRVAVDRVIGHRETGAPKACPCIDMDAFRITLREKTAEIDGLFEALRATARTVSHTVTVYTDGSVEVSP